VCQKFQTNKTFEKDFILKKYKNDVNKEIKKFQPDFWISLTG